MTVCNLGLPKHRIKCSVPGLFILPVVVVVVVVVIGGGGDGGIGDGGGGGDGGDGDGGGSDGGFVTDVFFCCFCFFSVSVSSEYQISSC